EDSDVVSRKAREIAKDSMKLRWLSETHADLFFKLPRKRRLDRLVPFDAAAWEEPAWPVAVAHEEHAVLAIDHHPLRAQGEPPPPPPEGTQHFGKTAHRRRSRFLRCQRNLQSLAPLHAPLYRRLCRHAEECTSLPEGQRMHISGLENLKRTPVILTIQSLRGASSR